MASSVENVINKALIGIGANKISSIDGTTPTAVAAKLFYDSARRSVIQDCNWGFARRTAVLETCKDVKVSDAIPRGVPENGRPDSRNFYRWEEVSQPYLMFDEPPGGAVEDGRVPDIGPKPWSVSEPFASISSESESWVEASMSIKFPGLILEGSGVYTVFESTSGAVLVITFALQPGGGLYYAAVSGETTISEGSYTATSDIYDITLSKAGLLSVSNTSINQLSVPSQLIPPDPMIISIQNKSAVDLNNIIKAWVK